MSYSRRNLLVFSLLTILIHGIGGAGLPWSVVPAAPTTTGGCACDGSADCCGASCCTSEVPSCCGGSDAVDDYAGPRLDAVCTCGLDQTGGAVVNAGSNLYLHARARCAVEPPSPESIAASNGVFRADALPEPDDPVPRCLS